MAENIIGLKTVKELLGMKFFIPSYQRGYRWTRQQVEDLLNDIEEFRKKKDSERNNNNKNDADDFYCLQPLVVKECIVKKNDFIYELHNINETEIDLIEKVRQTIANNTKWEVIDGQQRLTTLYILLSYLDVNDNDLFTIDYETRSHFDDFLKKIENSRCLETNDFDLKDLIDNKFGELIEGNNNFNNIDYYHILQTLVTVKNWFKEKDDSYKQKFKNTILDSVKFIWYESVEEDPIKVFTRLNIGKIKLTNAELIKALFLNRSNFNYFDYHNLRLRQQEIASEWDNIEYTFQNDEFWLFLHTKEYNRPTRIDLIFDLICEQKSLGQFNNIGADEYKTFRYFHEYFKSTTSQDNNIENCWKKVKKYFQTFCEWFNDLELYHYVGYLINEGHKLNDMYSLWLESRTKECFVSKLIENITKLLSDKDCNNLNTQYEINGGGAKTKCKPILLLHNIQTVIEQNKAYSSKEEYKLPVFYKFPFHLYKLENWDVEHIDSNTSNRLDKEKDQKEWLRYVSLDANLKNKEDLLNRIKKFIKNEDGKPSFEELENEINKYKNNSWDNAELDKNKIWNFVLLDAGTNRGYGNAIFPAKRRCIIEKDRGKTIIIDDDLNYSERDGAIAFIPPVTKNVFLKYYNKSDANFQTWNKIDAEAYKENIIKTLQQFGVYDSSSNDTKGENNEQQ